MSNLSTADRTVVAKLLGLIGSAHDAEALAAARKAYQIIRDRGATWLDALGLDASPDPGHVAEARELLGKGKAWLTDWERRFLVGIMAHKTLAPKQAEILDGIRAKINAASDNAA